jgi:hypothetical protein
LQDLARFSTKKQVFQANIACFDILDLFAWLQINKAVGSRLACKNTTDAVTRSLKMPALAVTVHSHLQGKKWQISPMDLHQNEIHDRKKANE